MGRLLTCLGEILIDFLPIEEGRHPQVIGSSETRFTMHAGGAPFNVAVGLARLDQQAAFASKVSTDHFGLYLRERIEKESIDARFVVPSDAQTTLAFVANEQGEPVFVFYGDNTADTLLTFDELPTTLFEETAILHFGGISLLRGVTPLAVLEIVERLKGHALLSFDPNIRPGLVRDAPAYRALLDRFFSLADIVKVSAADMAWLAPAQPVEQVARDLLARGPAMVVVTQGGKGVLALRDEDRFSIPGFSVQVVDTVGAGDAFSAGMLAGLADQHVTSRSALQNMPAKELAATLRYGAAVAALTCTRPGADPPQRGQVAQFLKEQPEQGDY